MYPTNPYYYMNYMNYCPEYDYSYSQTMNQNTGFNLYNNFGSGFGNNGFNINNSSSSNNSLSYVGNNVIYQEGDEVNQLRRSFDFYNLV